MGRRSYKPPSWWKHQRKVNKFKGKYQPKTSKLEKRFEIQILKPLCDKYDIEYQSQYRLKNKYYDFCIPSLNLIIEVDGVYYHAKDRSNLNEMQKRNIKNDNYKNKLAMKYGKKLVRFWGDDIRENKNLVYSKLNQKIKKLL